MTCKLKVVVFDELGGWVLTNPTPEEYSNLPHVINPDLRAVESLPPESWVLNDGKVVPKTGAVSRTTPSADLTKLLAAVSVMEKMRAEHEAANLRARRLLVTQIIVFSLLTVIQGVLIWHLS